MSRRPAVALGAVVVVLALLAPTTVAGAQGTGGSLTWHGCGSGFQCATLSVPDDWSQPGGPQVALAVSRHPASDPRHRLGTLVVNFGGPGDPGAETLRMGGLDGFPAVIRDRFDIVSFDPRGTGQSRPIACVDDATYDAFLAQDPTPDTPPEFLSFYAGTNGPVDLVAACLARQGQWLGQVGTRNTARDLEALRAALGAPKLTFLGFSYGTVLGSVYAQQYPDRVGSMVLDGAVNLSSTASSELEANAVGFEQALDAFLADCAAHPSCAYHRDGNPRAALAALQQRFESGYQVPVGDGRRAGATIFYLALAAALYDRANWPFLAHALDDAEHGRGELLARFADSITGRGPDGHYDHLQEALNAIRCDDRRDALASFDDYRAQYDRYSQQFPIFGAFLAASPIGCDPRLPAPPASEQLGDVRATGAAPILIVGTTGDPATPYAGAVDLQQRLAGSRLLTLVSTEHSGYGKGIACVDTTVDAYLIRHALPPVGRRCHP
jgi:pimeloyl-ACP methyl ester carboxylesterase